VSWAIAPEFSKVASKELVARDVLARVVGPDCNLDLVIEDIRAELRGRPYGLVALAGGCAPASSSPTRSTSPWADRGCSRCRAPRTWCWRQGCALVLTGKADHAGQKITSGISAYQSTGSTFQMPLDHLTSPRVLRTLGVVKTRSVHKVSYGHNPNRAAA
jgi:hypothetical protein